MHKKEKFVKYKLEDTSAAIQSIHWRSGTATDFAVGDLVGVRGKLAAFREQREIKISQIFELVRCV